MNTGKPSDPRSAQNTEQNSFSLIVERMCRRDLRHSAVPRQLPEEVVAQFAGGRFNSRVWRPVERCMMRVQFETVSLGELNDKPLVGV